MSSEVQTLTEEVRKHDRDLYAARFNNKIWIMRKAYQVESYNVDGLDVDFLVPSGQMILPLTEGWNPHGKPIPWGVLPVIQRLKEIDGWNRNHLQEVEEANQKSKDSSKRDFHNKVESFFYDSHSAFKRQFDGINTSTIK